LGQIDGSVGHKTMKEEQLKFTLSHRHKHTKRKMERERERERERNTLLAT